MFIALKKYINFTHPEKKIINKQIGTWRSPVAHLTGGQGAGGSNPLVPTI